MKYTINNITKQQIDSLCSIQEKEGNTISQKDDNLHRLFKTIEHTKKNPSCLKNQSSEIRDTFEPSFEINYPKVIENIKKTIYIDSINNQYEIVSEYLKQSADNLGFKTVNDLIEALDFQVLN